MSCKLLYQACLQLFQHFVLLRVLLRITLYIYLGLPPFGWFVGYKPGVERISICSLQPSTPPFAINVWLVNLPDVGAIVSHSDTFVFCSFLVFHRPVVSCLYSWYSSWCTRCCSFGCWYAMFSHMFLMNAVTSLIDKVGCWSSLCYLSE